MMLTEVDATLEAKGLSCSATERLALRRLCKAKRHKSGVLLSGVRMSSTDRMFRIDESP